jgi:hypothetical protein
MDKLKLAVQNLGRVFNFRHGRAFTPCTSMITAKLSSLKWKTWPQTTFRFFPVSFCTPRIVNKTKLEVNRTKHSRFVSIPCSCSITKREENGTQLRTILVDLHWQNLEFHAHNLDIATLTLAPWAAEQP